MAALAFLLECAATAALIGMAVSLLVRPALLVLRGRVLQRVPALRADLAFVLGTLPALVSMGVVAAAIAPLSLAHTAFLHHAVETALQLLF